MKRVIALSTLLLGSVLFADSFIEMPQKETKKLQPNVGYYIDARSGKVIESINVASGEKLSTSSDTKNKLTKKPHKQEHKSNTKRGYENEAFKIKEEIIELW
ncbi:MAG: hypothetical protein ACLFQJ_02880 [Campylobacterales bacterium]